MPFPASQSGGSLSVSFPLGLIRDWGTAGSQALCLDVLAKWLPELIDHVRASVTLLSDGGDSFQIIDLHGDVAVATGRIVSRDSTSGDVVETKSVHNIPSLVDSKSHFKNRLNPHIRLQSALSAPLAAGKYCIGSLNVARSALDAFNKDDEVLLGGIAEVLGATMLAQKRIENERDLGSTDGLTGLANRRHIMGLLDKELEAGMTPVLFVDLDGFKLINDAYGHHTGDQLLIEIADRLKGECAPYHHVGRIGGDEFLVLCNKAFDRQAALEFAQHLVEVCTRPVPVGSVVLQPRLSIGVAVPASDNATSSELLAQADQAMYRAKRTQVSLVEADEDVRHEAELIAAIDGDLEQALADDTIDFHYQPIRQLETNELLACESLIRWFHPTVGLVPPPLLIERAEATDRIDALTTWAIDRVARDLSALRSQNSAYLEKQFSFNLSPRQFGWVDYVETHMAALDRHGLIPSDILIEVVESGTIEVETTAESTIRALAERGATISLDDFGTGHNVISYFSRFPIHGIKIDRSMTNAMADNPSVFTIVKGLTQIATELNIESLGEGIETQAELDACLRAGMKVGQGYFLGRPMTFESLIELMHEEYPTYPDVQAA